MPDPVGPVLALKPQTSSPFRPAVTAPASSTPAAPPAPPDVAGRRIGDVGPLRQAVYDRSLEAAKSIPPMTDGQVTLALHDVDYSDPESHTPTEHKHALLTGDSLVRRMKGTWKLTDNQSGETLAERRQVVASVPRLTDFGSFLRDGTDFLVRHQLRSKAGLFVRRKKSGDVEAHANVIPGTGPQHRYSLDPAREAFRLEIGGAALPLYPLLKTLGASDDEIKGAWGDRIAARNSSDRDDPTKMAKKILRASEFQAAKPSQYQDLIRQSFARMKMDPEVVGRTLGIKSEALDKNLILAATKKMLQVHKNEVRPDIRDDLPYQKVLGPEDLFAEQIVKDPGRRLRSSFQKVSKTRSLDHMPSGALNHAFDHVLLNTGLALTPEEVNALELFDKQQQVTKLGEGGISGGEDAIPEESRQVSGTHANFIDPIRTPEDMSAGAVLHFASDVRKDKDGRIRAPFIDRRTGERVWKSPEDMAEQAIAFPGAFKEEGLRIPGIKKGQVGYYNRHEISHEMPPMQGSFSSLSNLIPGLSAIKQQRIAMASRMLTQALPLENPEAQFVQAGIPGQKGRSYAEVLGKNAGAVLADEHGHVVDVGKDKITVLTRSGERKDYPLYGSLPFSRKTYFEQTPLVKPGDQVIPGKPLAKSNYTDDKGHVALGLNARVAYYPTGESFEDAIAISESFAKKATSAHAYHFDHEVTPQHKEGLQTYLQAFPGRYSRAILDKIGDDGVVKPGQVVNQGDPLILSIRERQLSENKVHRRGQRGWADDSQVWEHHDPGIVTDVARSRRGPVVVVKAMSPSKIGDKFSGLFGDKGVTSKIIPDDQMPQTADGQPVDVLVNPQGIHTRANPAQLIEGALGKIARKTGQRQILTDFEGEGGLEKMTAYTKDQLKRHGLKDKETIYDPRSGRKVPNVFVGDRYMMKLHHTSESKGGGRSGGSYAGDETPSKGGPSGCLAPDTPIVCLHPGIQAGTAVKLADLIATNAAALLPTHRGVSEITEYFGKLVPRGEMLTISLDLGPPISCTKDHKWLRADGKLVRAADLVVGDEIEDLAGPSEVEEDAEETEA